MRQFIVSLIAIITVLLIGFSPLCLRTQDTPTTKLTTTTPATPTPPTPAPIVVVAAFDLDDTLIHSSPAFDHTKKHKNNMPFWHNVNACTPQFCPPLATGTTILNAHQSQHKRNNTLVYTYIVTARKDQNTEALTTWLINTFHVDGVFYTYKDNKAITLKALATKHNATHTYFYGDSDSDITAGMEAGYSTHRIVRPPFSNYTKKNNPGKYNEPIIPWNLHVISPAENRTSTQTPLSVKENNMLVFIILFVIMLYVTTAHYTTLSWVIIINALLERKGRSPLQSFMPGHTSLSTRLTQEEVDARPEDDKMWQYDSYGQDGEDLEQSITLHLHTGINGVDKHGIFGELVNFHGIGLQIGECLDGIEHPEYGLMKQLDQWIPPLATEDRERAQELHNIMADDFIPQDVDQYKQDEDYIGEAVDWCVDCGASGTPCTC